MTPRSSCPRRRAGAVLLRGGAEVWPGSISIRVARGSIRADGVSRPDRPHLRGALHMVAEQHAKRGWPPQPYYAAAG
jgi:hypothetical protein